VLTSVIAVYRVYQRRALTVVYACCRFGRMKSKTVTKKTKTSSARAKAKPAGKPAARKAAAKAPASRASVSAAPKAASYTPKPIEGIGWAPFRYSR
jgi:hypothetical protein